MKLTPVLPPREARTWRLPEMRLPGRLWLALGALAVVALFVITIVPPEARPFTARLFLLVIGLAGAWRALRRAAVIAASSPERFEDVLRRTAPARSEIAGLRSVETDVRMSTANAFGVERRLRPVLRELATWRLRRNHGLDLDLDRDAGAAHAILGDRLWALVKPADGLPGRREPHEPGIALADLQAAVDQLERV